MILSTIFSDYQDLAIKGFPQRYEGILVIISYFILWLASMVYCSNTDNIKTILTFLAISATLLSILGLCQFYGYDFWKTSIGKHTLLSGEDNRLFDLIGYTKNAIEGKNPVSLYNTNYSGSYFGIVFSIAAIFFTQSKNNKQHFFYGSIAILFFWNLFGSGSRGSIIASIVSLSFVSLLLRKTIINHIF